jgi:DNA-binding SARP family transcriptional activator
MDRKWRVELFGGLTVLKDGVPTAPEVASRAATRDLLALLVLNKGRWIDTDTLASKLWPEKWKALDNLHAATSRLRAALGDSDRDVFVRQGSLYRIDTDKVTTDVADVDRLARKITFADGIDDDLKTALSEIEELYKGDLLGRGEPCRNQTISAYNREYRQKMLGVWECAAGLYLERGDSTSRIRAQWYIENIKRLQGPEAIEGRTVKHQEILGEPSARRGTDVPKPSIRSQLAEGKRQIALQSAAPLKAAARSHGMEI